MLKLAHKVVLGISLAIITNTLVISWISYAELNTSIRTHIDKELSKTSLLSREKIELWLSNKQLAIESLTSILQNSPTSSHFIEFLEQAKNSAEMDLAYLGLENGDIYRNSGLNTVIDYDPRKRGWYKKAKSDKKLVYTKPFIAASTKQLTITIAMPYTGRNGSQGVVGGSINLNKVVEEIKNIEVPGEGTAFLLSNSGYVIAHKRPELINKHYEELHASHSVEEILPSASDNSEVLNVEFDNVEYFLKATKVANTDWVLVVTGKKDTLISPLKKTATYLLATSTLILLLSVFLVYFLITFLLKDLMLVSSLLKDIAVGSADLTQRIKVKSNDEIGSLSMSFNAFTKKLQSILSRVKEVTEDINEQSCNAASLSESLDDKANKQQAEIDMVATASTEMVSATDEIAQNCDFTAKAAQTSVDLCEKGKLTAESSYKSIEGLQAEVLSAREIISKLNEHGKHINSIVNTINDISDQTNLLALNAAIEAARAGEHGRGFAVVSDEVRILSQRTRLSTDEIAQMICDLQLTSEEAVQVMNHCHSLTEETVINVIGAKDAFNEVTESIHRINDMTVQIATASEEQTVVTDEISRNVVNISEVARQFLDNSSLSHDQSTSLSNLSDDLQGLVSKFILK